MRRSVTELACREYRARHRGSTTESLKSRSDSDIEAGIGSLAEAINPRFSLSPKETRQGIPKYETPGSKCVRKLWIGSWNQLEKRKKASEGVLVLVFTRDKCFSIVLHRSPISHGRIFSGFPGLVTIAYPPNLDLWFLQRVSSAGTSNRTQGS